MGARVTGRVPNVIFNPINGEANDTIMYSQLLLSTSNDTMLVNYIDLANATGVGYIANPFSLAVPGANRPALDAAIEAYTTVLFSGSSAWDLIVFTFGEIWNKRMPGFLITVEITEISNHPAVLLDYGGNGALGYVAFVNMGNKIAVLFNALEASGWTSTATFNTSIQAYVTGFLEPLRDILYIAGFNQESIIGSSSPGAAVPSTNMITGNNSTNSIAPAEIGMASAYLGRDAFLSFASTLLAGIPVPEYPFLFSWNQIAIIIVIVIALALVIYYGLSSYNNEKKKVPDAPRGNEGFTIEYRGP
jgi:hypothetical protein